MEIVSPTTKMIISDNVISLDGKWGRAAIAKLHDDNIDDGEEVKKETDNISYGFYSGSENNGHVTLLSTSYLRNSLENEVKNIGEEVLNINHMRENNPHLFWNMLWYNTILGVSNNLNYHCAEDTSKYKSEIIIAGSHVGIALRRARERLNPKGYYT